MLGCSVQQEVPKQHNERPTCTVPTSDMMGLGTLMNWDTGTLTALLLLRLHMFLGMQAWH